MTARCAEPQPREIVGVVADVTYPSFFTETPAAVYVPFRQHMAQYGREDEWIHTRKALAVRASVDPLTLVRGVQDAIAHVDRDQAAHDFMTMEQRVASSPSVTNSRFFASLFSVFGTLGDRARDGRRVRRDVVGGRTADDRVRHPHGARRPRARRRRACCWRSRCGRSSSAWCSAWPGGFGLSRALNSMFWRMTTADPLVLGAISVLMLAVALLAAWVPVHRVTRIDPQHALRHE